MQQPCYNCLLISGGLRFVCFGYLFPQIICIDNYISTYETIKTILHSVNALITHYFFVFRLLELISFSLPSLFPFYPLPAIFPPFFFISFFPLSSSSLFLSFLSFLPSVITSSCIKTLWFLQFDLKLVLLF